MRRLEQVRKAKGMSLAALGRIAEMHPTTVGQIENGYIGRPYASQMEKLSAALGWPVERSGELLDEVGVDA